MIKLTPGMKSSEFYLTLIANVIAIFDYAQVWTVAPVRYVVVLQTVVTGLYTLSRGWAKSGGTKPA